MQTIGQYFKEGRALRGLSFSELEEITKIKKDFLKAIENLEWANLPEYPVLFGFIKNITRSLELNEQKAIALFRRDYPFQKVSLSPKPDLPKEFRWSPRLTFFLGVCTVVIIIIGYLGFQYFSFTKPPRLDVVDPTQNQIVNKRELKIAGRTDPEAVVRVNNQPVLVSENGSFETVIEIFEGTTEVIISATSRSGKNTTVVRTIKPELN